MWLIATIFEVEKHEIPILGFGSGLVLYLWIANILGHFLPSVWAFILPAPLVFLFGFLSKKIINSQKKISIPIKIILIESIIFIVLGTFFIFIGRGLAIFDERKNLSLISLMANGDIPPHNPLDPTKLYQYHYGSQLLGASLVKIGGFFPWSAFDISKGIYWGLAILLIYLFFHRFTSKNWLAILFSAIYPLLSGTRFLLMAFPQKFLAGLDSKITLLGSSQDMGLPFSKALYANWVIGGGPPKAYPYGFINGILKPLVMSHSGTETFALAIVLMIFLLSANTKNPAAKWYLAILFAYLALAWESTYGLLALVIACFFLIQSLLKKGEKNTVCQILLVSGLISIPLVLLQGGTMHEMAKSLLNSFLLSTPSTPVQGLEEGLFTFQWPPAIFSGHLGALSVFDPAQLVVGLCEIGPSIFFIPSIGNWLRSIPQQTERTVLTLLFLSAMLGLLIPVFLTYPSSARDITRFSGYGLSILILLLLLFILEKWNSQKKLIRFLEVLSVAAMAVGGFVVGAVQLSALSEPVLSEGIDGWDARIGREVWGKLPQDGWIYDPSNQNWRAVVISGIPAPIDAAIFPGDKWEKLRANPQISQFLANGFSYIYIDEKWWNALDQSNQAELSLSCIKEMASVKNGENSIWRRLVYINNCK